jgi:hypothetical protein
MTFAADAATDLDSTFFMTLTSSVCLAVPSDPLTPGKRLILSGQAADQLISGKKWQNGDRKLRRREFTKNTTQIDLDQTNSASIRYALGSRIDCSR